MGLYKISLDCSQSRRASRASYRILAKVAENEDCVGLVICSLVEVPTVLWSSNGPTPA